MHQGGKAQFGGQVGWVGLEFGIVDREGVERAARQASALRIGEDVEGREFAVDPPGQALDGDDVGQPATQIGSGRVGAFADIGGGDQFQCGDPAAAQTGLALKVP